MQNQLNTWWKETFRKQKATLNYLIIHRIYQDRKNPVTRISLHLHFACLFTLADISDISKQLLFNFFPIGNSQVFGLFVEECWSAACRRLKKTRKFSPVHQQQQNQIFCTSCGSAWTLTISLKSDSTFLFDDACFVCVFSLATPTFNNKSEKNINDGFF